ncbi:MAG: cobalamin ABC transporter substrate-binding protein [Polyangiaceae bacterium]
MELFDDAIEPTAVGYELDSALPPTQSPVLRERTQTADAVIRARVVTVTSTPEDSGRSFQIGLRTLEGLAGSQGPAALTLHIRETDPAAGIVRAAESHLIGLTVIAFLRQFRARDHATPDGQLHFHIGPDSKAELRAVREAVLLGEVR